jgi:hypothetical protein
VQQLLLDDGLERLQSLGDAYEAHCGGRALDGGQPCDSDPNDGDDGAAPIDRPQPLAPVAEREQQDRPAEHLRHARDQVQQRDALQHSRRHVALRRDTNRAQRHVRHAGVSTMRNDIPTNIARPWNHGSRSAISRL